MHKGRTDFQSVACLIDGLEVRRTLAWFTPFGTKSFGGHERQQVADCAMRFNSMPQRFIGNDAILVLAAYFLSFDDVCFFKVSNDPLDSSFSNPNLNGNLP